MIEDILVMFSLRLITAVLLRDVYAVSVTAADQLSATIDALTIVVKTVVYLVVAATYCSCTFLFARDTQLQTI